MISAWIASLFLVFGLSSCQPKEASPEEVQAVLVQYAQMVYLNYQDALTEAQQLYDMVALFATEPNQNRLEGAKAAWIKARLPYGLTEAYRFYGGPIDHDALGREGFINAWPMDEGFIDYVEGRPDAGLIQQVDFDISPQNLRNKNEEDGIEVNVAVGYHAIEFLLWGQDQADASLKTPGQRPLTDFTSAPFADRRLRYLTTLCQLLLSDLAFVSEQWKPGSAYYTEFVAGGKTSLSKILTGIGSLSKAELAGERMKVALQNHDQEDEHSCFSDQTHHDIEQNAQGIVNVYLGQYQSLEQGTLSGASLADLVEKMNPELNAKMKAALDKSITACQAIQAPFDLEISGENPAGNARVQAAIDALEDHTDVLEEVAALLKLEIQTNG